jgi:Leucine-rich repeat (LRR) protein
VCPNRIWYDLSRSSERSGYARDKPDNSLASNMTIATTAELEELIEIVKFGTLAIDLYGCQLEHLPENIGDLIYLQTLKFNGNRLTTLPESIGNLKQLSTLSLNGHRLTNLPESIGNLINLTHLNLNGDRLTSLPDRIANLTQLVELNLNSNQLDCLPASLLSLPNLRKLNLDSNPLTDLSNLRYIPNLRISRSPTRSKFKLVKLKQSTKLIVGDRYLKPILGNLSSFTNIISLHLNGYGLTRILETNHNGTVITFKLREDISADKILDKIPILPRLSSLTWHINLVNYFNIIGKSPSIKHVSCLGISLCGDFNRPGKSLDLTLNDCQFTDLSILKDAAHIKHKIWYFPEIDRRYWTKFSDWEQEWLLDENNDFIRRILIKRIGCDIEWLIELAASRQVTSLNLRAMGITRLSNKIGEINSLVDLDLRHNQLKILPSSISNLTKLTKIYLDGNPLTDLSILKRLPKLKSTCFLIYDLPLRYHTKFSDWQLKWLLDENNSTLRQEIVKYAGCDIDCLIEVAKRERLTVVNLSNLHLKELPNGIGELNNLTELNLSGNRLTVLPDSIGNLRNLTTLKLPGNLITNLPDSISRLNNLVELNLNNNNLTELPKSIGNIEPVTNRR